MNTKITSEFGPKDKDNRRRSGMNDERKKVEQAIAEFMISMRYEEMFPYNIFDKDLTMEHFDERQEEALKLFHNDPVFNHRVKAAIAFVMDKTDPDSGFYFQWDDLIKVMRQVYPLALYDESPMELVQNLIDEYMGMKIMLARWGHGITTGEEACGNCQSYQWDDSFDRDKGRCSHTENKDCPALAASTTTGLDALTFPGDCPFWFDDTIQFKVIVKK